MTGDARNPEAAERLAHPNLCGFCKSALAWAIGVPAGRRLFVALAASCDGCRRLAPILRTLPGVADAISFDLPRTAGPADIERFAAELSRLHAALCERLGTPVDEARMREAIGLYREARAAVLRVIDAALAGRLPVRAAFDAADALFTKSPEDATTSAADALGASTGPAPGRRPKVILAGNLTFDASLAEAIERAGASVVGLDLCNVERAARIEVADGGDLYLALARAVFARPLCPRFEPGLDWAVRLAESARATGARGVVLASLKFCDNTLYAYPAMKAYLEERGVAVLALETDYAPGVPGQVATRIEAFVEML
jgi:benzoyl-CoA reductase/2-hydroxyglutaryl-CoA dehydratase subunit BcrC/BadD/HgdB